MIVSFLVGIAAGLVLAMPPGPIGVTAIRMGISGKVKPGIYLGLGTGLMDFFFCLAAIFTSSAAVKALDFLSADYPVLMLIAQILIIAALIGYGIISFAGKKKVELNDSIEQKKHTKFIENLMHKGPFLFGIAIALTNIPNPTFLPSLTVLAAQLHKLGIIENLILNNLFYALGFGIGNFLWIVIILKIMNALKSRISSSAATRISQFAGLSLIGVGTFLGYRLITLTHWPDILRIIFAF